MVIGRPPPPWGGGGSLRAYATRWRPANIPKGTPYAARRGYDTFNDLPDAKLPPKGGGGLRYARAPSRDVLRFALWAKGCSF